MFINACAEHFPPHEWKIKLPRLFHDKLINLGNAAALANAVLESMRSILQSQHDDLCKSCGVGCGRVSPDDGLVDESSKVTVLVLTLDGVLEVRYIQRGICPECSVGMFIYKKEFTMHTQLKIN